MSKVRRIYVEKKDQFAVAARGLEHEVKSYLGIKDLEKVRILIRYDVENISDEVYERAAAVYFLSRRLISFMKKVSLWRKMRRHLRWNFSRDSLISVQTPLFSV